LGKRGKPIDLYANMFLLEAKEGDVFLYDVQVEPEKMSKKLRKQLILHITRLEGLQGLKPVSDFNALMWSARAIPSKSWPHKFEIKPEALFGKVERPQKPDIKKKERPPKIFKVILNTIGKIDMSLISAYINKQIKEMPRTQLQVIDVVMRYLLQTQHFPVGKNIFYPSLDGYTLSMGNGVDLWFGHYQSVRLTQRGLMLNVDTAATAMIEPLPVIDYLKGKLNRELDFPKDLNICNKFLKKIQLKMKTFKSH